jgi:hypothetical protein
LGAKKFAQTFQRDCLKNPVLWKLVKRSVVKADTSVGTSTIFVWHFCGPKTGILLGRIISIESLLITLSTVMTVQKGLRENDFQQSFWS